MTQAGASDADHKKSLVREAAGTKTWHHVVRADADAAAAYLNTDPAQGPGEATITTRPDGQIDILAFL
ncbi:hypothetical protein ACIQI7_12475 [Kitasatospora sp. NPDC092039]|uniref:hypothetical protein n=1 Tax=Kitasatospora sp. NPDC092039 TaxID=3364086 RepID=UPI00380DC031